MEKVLLLSVLAMMVVIPLHASRVPNATVSLRKTMTRFFAFNLVYWVTVLFVWFTLIHGGDATTLLHPLSH